MYSREHSACHSLSLLLLPPPPHLCLRVPRGAPGPWRWTRQPRLGCAGGAWPPNQEGGGRGGGGRGRRLATSKTSKTAAGSKGTGTAETPGGVEGWVGGWVGVRVLTVVPFALSVLCCNRSLQTTVAAEDRERTNVTPPSPTTTPLTTAPGPWCPWAMGLDEAATPCLNRGALVVATARPTQKEEAASTRPPPPAPPPPPASPPTPGRDGQEPRPLGGRRRAPARGGRWPAQVGVGRRVLLLHHHEQGRRPCSRPAPPTKQHRRRGHHRGGGYPVVPLEAAGGWRRARLGMAVVVGGGITEDLFGRAGRPSWRSGWAPAWPQTPA